MRLLIILQKFLIKYNFRSFISAPLYKGSCYFFAKIDGRIISVAEAVFLQPIKYYFAFYIVNDKNM